MSHIMTKLFSDWEIFQKVKKLKSPEDYPVDRVERCREIKVEFQNRKWSILAPFLTVLGYCDIA